MQCVAHGCRNRYTKKVPGLSFHKFPKNEEQREAWIKAVKRKEWIITAYSHLCSDHFTEDCFYRFSPFRVMLRENAVPTVFKASPSYPQNVSEARKSPEKHDATPAANTIPRDISIKVEAVPGSFRETIHLSKDKYPSKEEYKWNLQVSEVRKSPEKHDATSAANTIPQDICIKVEPVPESFRENIHLSKDKSPSNEEYKWKLEEAKDKSSSKEEYKRKLEEAKDKSSSKEEYKRKLEEATVKYHKKLRMIQQSRRRRKEQILHLNAVISKLKDKRLMENDALQTFSKFVDPNR